MTTAVVTGAAGLLGRATVNGLADRGVEVHAIVRDAGQAFRNDVVFHEIDLAQPIDSAALPASIDLVFHLAQAREFRDFPGSAQRVFAINVASTATFLDYAARVGAGGFVYASSGGVYQAAEKRPVLETDLLQDPARLGYYLATKLSSESLVGSYSALFSTAVLRYFFIYGAGQSRSMLIPRLYDRVASGEPLSLQGDDGMRINPVHVDDAASATIAAAGIEGTAVVNVAGPEALSLREIGETFAKHLGREAVFERSADEPSDLIASTALMGKLLVPPSITLRQSLSDLGE